MNRFEHFTLVFYVIDAYYGNNKNEELRLFLSDMCPFTFKDIGSAVSYVYDDYCVFVADIEISMSNSFSLALSYINHLVEKGNTCVAHAFDGVNEKMWLDGAKDYLSSAHKGMNI